MNIIKLAGNATGIALLKSQSFSLYTFSRRGATRTGVYFLFLLFYCPFYYLTSSLMRYVFCGIAALRHIFIYIDKKPVRDNYIRMFQIFT